MNILETERLTATRLGETDLSLIRKMDTDPAVMKTLGGLRSEQESAQYHQSNLEHWRRHGYGLWILHEKPGGTFAGRAALRHVRVAEHDEIEVGYALMPAFWGRGLATEIAQEIVRIAFDVHRLPSVVAFTLPDNLGSRNVIEKIGGQFECETTYKGFPHVLYRIRPQAADSR